MTRCRGSEQRALGLRTEKIGQLLQKVHPLPALRCETIEFEPTLDFAVDTARMAFSGMAPLVRFPSMTLYGLLLQSRFVVTSPALLTIDLLFMVSRKLELPLWFKVMVLWIALMEGPGLTF